MQSNTRMGMKEKGLEKLSRFYDARFIGITKALPLNEQYPTN